MKRIHLIVTALLCGLFFIVTTVVAVVGSFNAAGDARQQDEMERLRQAGVAAGEKYLGGEPSEITDDMLKDGEVLFKGNAHDLNSHYVDPAEKYDFDEMNRVGANLLANKIMTYKEYLDQYDDNCIMTDVDPMRMVRVVSVFYPGEYDTLRGGIYKNATVTGLYDAETGFYFGGFVQGEQVPMSTDDGGYAGPRG